MPKYFDPGPTLGKLHDIPGSMMRSGGSAQTAVRARSIANSRAADRGESSTLRSNGPQIEEQVLIDRPQVAASKCYPFDRQSIPTGVLPNVAAGIALFPLLTVVIPADVRGVIRRFGWYTAGAATAFLSFGLFVNAERVLPGGRWIQDTMQTVLAYNPSGGSIDFDRLTECNIDIPQNGTVTIRVSNANPALGYQAWARVWGDHWSAV
jgi:hypothetical protein